MIKKVNSSYDLTDNAKVYVTYSEGFRRGGANALPLTGPYASLPGYQSFAPDVAKNYEVGFKGTVLDRRLRYSADIFRIDLNNFQFDTVNFAGFPVTFNGKKARSQGAEVELQALLGGGASATLATATPTPKSRSHSICRITSLTPWSPVSAARGRQTRCWAAAFNPATGCQACRNRQYRLRSTR